VHVAQYVRDQVYHGPPSPYSILKAFETVGLHLTTYYQQPEKDITHANMSACKDTVVLMGVCDLLVMSI